jgi:hypothetical protein
MHRATGAEKRENMKAFLRSLLFTRYGTFRWCLFGSVFQYQRGANGEFLTPFPYLVSQFLGNHGFTHTDYLPFRDYLNRDKLDINSASYDPSYRFHSVI